MSEFEGLPVPARYWSALTVWLALTMAVLDGAIANVALPTIARELSAAPASSIWVVNGYQLAIVVSLLPLAALGEKIGYRRVFLAGVVVFTVGSAGCALSHTLATLIATRVVQGLGAAAIMSVNGALVRFTYPARHLGRGIGFNALVVSAAAALRADDRLRDPFDRAMGMAVRRQRPDRRRRLLDRARLAAGKSAFRELRRRQHCPQHPDFRPPVHRRRRLDAPRQSGDRRGGARFGASSPAQRWLSARTRSRGRSFRSTFSGISCSR